VSRRLICNQPDRDEPRIKCGYPLPCPWHTAVMDLSHEPATVTIPVTAKSARKAAKKLFRMAKLLGETERE
jgi:hypothetical protein